MSTGKSAVVGYGNRLNETTELISEKLVKIKKFPSALTIFLVKFSVSVSLTQLRGKQSD